MVDRLSITSDRIIAEIEFTTGAVLPESDVVGASKQVSQLDFTLEKSHSTDSLEELSQVKATSPKDSPRDNLRNRRTTSTESLTEDWLERFRKNDESILGTQKVIPPKDPKKFNDYTLTTNDHLKNWVPDQYPKDLKFLIVSKKEAFRAQDILPRTPHNQSIPQNVAESLQQPSVTNVAESSQQTVASHGDKSIAQPAAAEESNVVMVSKKAHCCFAWRSPKLDRLVGRGTVELIWEKKV